MLHGKFDSVRRLLFWGFVVVAVLGAVDHYLIYRLHDRQLELFDQAYSRDLALAMVEMVNSEIVAHEAIEHNPPSRQGRTQIIDNTVAVFLKRSNMVGVHLFDQQGQVLYSSNGPNCEVQYEEIKTAMGGRVSFTIPLAGEDYIGSYVCQYCEGGSICYMVPIPLDTQGVLGVAVVVYCANNDAMHTVRQQAQLALMVMLIPGGFFVILLWYLNRNINQLEAMEMAVRQVEARYRHLFDNLSEGLYRATEEGELIDINESAIKLFGCRVPSDLIGANIHGLLNPMEFETENLTAAFKLNLGGGRSVWIEHSDSRSFDPILQKMVVTGVLRDVTTRVKMEVELASRDRIMQSELVVSRDIQQALMPKVPRDFSNLTIALRSTQCNKIGGDCYSFMPNENDSTMGIVVYDVCGHGVFAALLNVICMNLFPRDWKMAPGEAVADFNNRYISRVGSEYFITLFYGMIDTKRHQIYYVNAGHPFSILQSGADGSLSFADQKDLIVGFKPNVLYQTNCLDYNPGDRLFVYTDGVVENRNSSGECYDEKRLFDMIKKYHGRPVEEVVNSIYEDVCKHSGPKGLDDDLTLIGIEL